MTTPGTAVPPVAGPLPPRLRRGRTMGVDRLDGGWWPRSGDLTVELAGLVDYLPAELGRVVRGPVLPAGRLRPSPADIDAGQGDVCVTRAWQRLHRHRRPCPQRSRADRAVRGNPRGGAGAARRRSS
ncbi:DUF5994 family protein [Nocardioides sp. LHD-245]|uniref:DUF5994 family protein n=1 Tax=Nocardioides sp. LHD-245 TaxID=3051387 RepID=UPI0037098F4A